MPLKFKKEKKTEEEVLKETRRKTAQDWMPIMNIMNNVIYRKDKHVVGILRINPENLELFSNREKKQMVESFVSGYNELESDFQFFFIGRAIDLNDYLDWMQEKIKNETNSIKKSLLSGYVEQAAELSANGEITERQFFFIVTKKEGKNVVSDIKKELEHMMETFASIGMSAHICEDRELLELCSLFSNPVQASFERNDYQFIELPMVIED